MNISNDVKHKSNDVAVPVKCEDLLDQACDILEYSINDARELLSTAEMYVDSELDKLQYQIVRSNLLVKDEQYEKALPILLELCQKVEVLSDKWRISVYNLLGILYAFMEEHALSLDYFEKMRYTAIEAQDAHNEALAIHNMALLLGKIDYYEKAKEIWLVTGYDVGVVGCLRNHAFNLLRSKPEQNIERIFNMGSEALEIANTLDSLYWKGLSHHILAELYAHKGNRQKCLEHIKFFRHYFEEAGLSNASLRIVAEAHVFQVLEEHDTVISLGQAALDLEIAKRRKLKIYKFLIKSYAAINDYEQAYSYQTEFIRVNDEIHSVENTIKTRMLEVIHDTKLAKQKTKLEQEKVKLEKEKSEALQNYIHKLEKLNSEIQELSQRDELTGLFNRRYLMEELSRLTELTKRYESDVSLVILDADHFKNVNDTFGHTVGDKVLQVIAKILQDMSRKSDVTARYGGEEFVMVLPETNMEAALIVCERIRQKIQDYPWNIVAEDLSVTVSMGLSKFRRDMTLEDLLNSADDMLYRAKDAGRNCIRVSMLEHFKDQDK